MCPIVFKFRKSWYIYVQHPTPTEFRKYSNLCLLWAVNPSKIMCLEPTLVLYSTADIHGTWGQEGKFSPFSLAWMQDFSRIRGLGTVRGGGMLSSLGRKAHLCRHSSLRPLHWDNTAFLHTEHICNISSSNLFFILIRVDLILLHFTSLQFTDTAISTN